MIQCIASHSHPQHILGLDALPVQSVGRGRSYLIGIYLIAAHGIILVGVFAVVALVLTAQHDLVDCSGLP